MRLEGVELEEQICAQTEKQIMARQLPTEALLYTHASERRDDLWHGGRRRGERTGSCSVRECMQLQA